MKKIIRSSIRTIAAVAMIAIGIKFGTLALNWKVWCPDNDFGFAIVASMYLGTFFSIMTGLYNLSPMFVEAVVAALTNDEDIMAETKKRIRKMRRNFVW